MPAEQIKSTLTRACWCKLLNCSGARFLRNFAKKPCTLKRITFWFFLKSGDNQWILTVKTKVLTHKIEILTRFYIIAFANAIIQQTLIYLYSLRIAVIFCRLIRAVSFNRLCVTLTQFIMGNHKVIKLIRSSERRFCNFFKIFFG